GIAVDREGLVYVADRENSRIQIFNLKGDFLKQWTDTKRPMQVFIDKEDNIFVVDVGWKGGRFPWQVPPPDPPGPRLTVFNRAGQVLARWGDEGEDPSAPGCFFAPHDLWIDSHGDIYVGEVIISAGGKPDYHALQKLVRCK